MEHLLRKTTMSFMLVAALLLIAGPQNAVSQVSIGFIGAGATEGDLNPDAAAAMQFAVDFDHSPTYISLDDIEDASAFDGQEVVWWHFDGYDGGTDLPPAATEEDVLAAFDAYVEGGGALYLSGMAAQLITAMGIEEETPAWIVNNDGIEAGEWGFYQTVEDHPIFDGLPNPFYTVSEGMTFTESIAWFDEPQLENGTRLAMIEIGGDHPGVTTGEWLIGDGVILNVTTGAYVFDWEGSNVNSGDLYEYTNNILDYLASFEPTSAGNESDLPTQVSLNQNYPNPFNPTTNLPFQLNKTESVTITVYDVMGRVVETLVHNETFAAGQHHVNFDASGLSSGVYLYELKTGAMVETRMMNFVK